VVIIHGRALPVYLPMLNLPLIFSEVKKEIKRKLQWTDTLLSLFKPST